MTKKNTLHFTELISSFGLVGKSWKCSLLDGWLGVGCLVRTANRLHREFDIDLDAN